MPDIFNKGIVAKKGPLARAETMQILVDGQMIALAQNVNINYGQQLQPVYQLGNFDSWMVSGRTQGNITMSRVVGSPNGGAGGANRTIRDILPDDEGKSFWEADGSQGGVLTLHDGAVDVDYLCKGCYVNNAGVGADANGSVVVENVSMMIQSLEIFPGNKSA